MGRQDKVFVRTIAVGEGLITFMLAWLVLARVTEQVIAQPTAAVVAITTAAVLGILIAWLMAGRHRRTLEAAAPAA